ncbi:MAG: Ig-like domain-containing protein [Acidimicrobiia bacterium]|nr:Ig-like domain-containing protein [Acidimicrobiia bacterium]
MSLTGVSVRRTLGLLLAVVLLFGVTTVIATHSADAAYPGGHDWVVFEGPDTTPPDTDIWAVRADGTTAAPVNLSNNLFIEGDPVFSPDGSQIAFTRYDPTPAIYVADFDTSGPTPVIPPLSITKISSGSDTEPTWSPDGTKIAYGRLFVTPLPSVGTATQASPTGTVLEDALADFVTDGIRTYDIVTNGRTGATGVVTGRGVTTVLMSGGLSGGSPDNEWKVGDAYTIERRNNAIFWSPANGSNLAGTRLSPALSHETYNDTEPAWQPTESGTLLAFSSTQFDSNWDILTMNSSTGGGRTNLTPDTGGPFPFDNVASRASWSPDGASIAFQIGEAVGQSTSDKNVWTISSTGASPVQVTGATNTGTDEDLEPAWSPDGSLIAFRRSGVGADRVYTIAADGSGAVSPISPLVAVPSIHKQPDWRPMLDAIDDSYAVDEGGTLNGAVNVTDNDGVLLTAIAGAATVTLGTDVSNGTLSLGPSGTFTYTHDDSETTTDSFTYTLSQGGQSDMATVNITVNPVDEDPVALPESFNVSNGATLNVPAPGVLDNDEDPEGLGLTAVKVADPSHGTVMLNANGSFSYTHDGSDTAFDSFTYQAMDPGGNKSAVTSVSLNVGPIDPDPPSPTIAGDAFGLPGQLASFTATVTDGSGPRTYAWTATRFGVTVASGSAATFAFTPIGTGVHTVSLTVTDDAGSGTDSVSYTILTDIIGNTFAADIVWLANEGITRGCNPPTNDQFCPDNSVTRGQMAAFLVRFLGLTAIDPSISFTDTGSSIFEQDILKLATAGITRGCNADGTRFCPDDSVTRGQMAAFLVRALGLTNNGGGDLFVDDDDSIFEDDIDKLATAGVTRGCNPPLNTNFCPGDTVTRGQMAAFLHRADDLI